MTGVSRRCIICELRYNTTSPATLQCHTCFRIDDKHMQLKSCLYCDKCYREVHTGDFAEHTSSPLFGPEYEELREETVWEMPAKNENQPGAKQVIIDENDENKEATYQFELYAIICENTAGHVVYVSADVELPQSTIEKHSHSCDENQTQDSSTEQAARTVAPDADATTKPKDPADAAKVQPAPSEPTESAMSTTSDTAIDSGEQGQLAGARKNQDEDVPAWLIFNPEEFVREDARGGYNLPQVHTVVNFDDLISSSKSGVLDPLDIDPFNQLRYRVLCESVAMFYRPKMEIIKPKPKDQSAGTNTAEEQVNPANEGQPGQDVTL